jgi:hypothetical protein
LPIIIPLYLLILIIFEFISNLSRIAFPWVINWSTNTTYCRPFFSLGSFQQINISWFCNVKFMISNVSWNIQNILKSENAKS